MGDDFQEMRNYYKKKKEESPPVQAGVASVDNLNDYKNLIDRIERLENIAMQQHNYVNNRFDSIESKIGSNKVIACMILKVDLSALGQNAAEPLLKSAGCTWDITEMLVDA